MNHQHPESSAIALSPSGAAPVECKSIVCSLHASNPAQQSSQNHKQEQQNSDAATAAAQRQQQQLQGAAPLAVVNGYGETTKPQSTLSSQKIIDPLPPRQHQLQYQQQQQQRGYDIWSLFYSNSSEEIVFSGTQQPISQQHKTLQQPQPLQQQQQPQTPQQQLQVQVQQPTHAQHPTYASRVAVPTLTKASSQSSNSNGSSVHRLMLRRNVSDSTAIALSSASEIVPKNPFDNPLTSTTTTTSTTTSSQQQQQQRLQRISSGSAAATTSIATSARPLSSLSLSSSVARPPPLPPPSPGGASVMMPRPACLQRNLSAPVPTAAKNPFDDFHQSASRPPPSPRVPPSPAILPQPATLRRNLSAPLAPAKNPFDDSLPLSALERTGVATTAESMNGSSESFGNSSSSSIGSSPLPRPRSLRASARSISATSTRRAGVETIAESMNGSTQSFGHSSNSSIGSSPLPRPRALHACARGISATSTHSVDSVCSADVMPPVTALNPFVTPQPAQRPVCCVIRSSPSTQQQQQAPPPLANPLQTPMKCQQSLHQPSPPPPPPPLPQSAISTPLRSNTTNIVAPQLQQQHQVLASAAAADLLATPKIDSNDSLLLLFQTPVQGNQQQYQYNNKPTNLLTPQHDADTPRMSGSRRVKFPSPLSSAPSQQQQQPAQLQEEEEEEITPKKSNVTMQRPRNLLSPVKKPQQPQRQRFNASSLLHPPWMGTSSSSCSSFSSSKQNNRKRASSSASSSTSSSFLRAPQPPLHTEDQEQARQNPTPPRTRNHKGHRGRAASAAARQDDASTASMEINLPALRQKRQQQNGASATGAKTSLRGRSGNSMDQVLPHHYERQDNHNGSVTSYSRRESTTTTCWNDDERSTTIQVAQQQLQQQQQQEVGEGTVGSNRYKHPQMWKLFSMIFVCVAGLAVIAVSVAIPMTIRKQQRDEVMNNSSSTTLPPTLAPVSVEPVEQPNPSPPAGANDTTRDKDEGIIEESIIPDPDPAELHPTSSWELLGPPHVGPSGDVDFGRVMAMSGNGRMIAVVATLTGNHTQPPSRHEFLHTYEIDPSTGQWSYRGEQNNRRGILRHALSKHSDTVKHWRHGIHSIAFNEMGNCLAVAFTTETLDATTKSHSYHYNRSEVVVLEFDSDTNQWQPRGNAIQLPTLKTLEQNTSFSLNSTSNSSSSSALSSPPVIAKLNSDGTILATGVGTAEALTLVVYEYSINNNDNSQTDSNETLSSWQAGPPLERSGSFGSFSMDLALDARVLALGHAPPLTVGGGTNHSSSSSPGPTGHVEVFEFKQGGSPNASNTSLWQWEPLGLIPMGHKIQVSLSSSGGRIALTRNDHHAATSATATGLPRVLEYSRSTFQWTRLGDDVVGNGRNNATTSERPQSNSDTNNNETMASGDGATATVVSMNGAGNRVAQCHRDGSFSVWDLVIVVANDPSTQVAVNETTSSTNQTANTSATTNPIREYYTWKRVAHGDGGEHYVCSTLSMAQTNASRMAVGWLPHSSSFLLSGRYGTSEDAVAGQILLYQEQQQQLLAP